MTAPSPPADPTADPLLAIRHLLLRGDFAAAAAWLQTFTAAHPNDARAHGLLAKCLRETGDFEGAERAALTSLEHAPDLLATRRELVLLRRDRGDHAGALHALSELLERAPGDPSLWWELSIMQSANDPDAALVSLQRVCALRPEDIEPRLLRAQLQHRLGRHQEAEADALWVVARQRDRVEALDIAYWSMAKRGIESPQRLAIARHVAGLAPTGERLLALSHDCYLAGDFATGRAAIARAIEVAPDFLPAYWARFQLPDAPVPVDEAAADRFRQQWREGIARFEAIDFTTDAALQHVWGCVGQSTAFYRHYLDDAVDDQRRYGALLSRMMAAIAPGIAARPMRASRRRIGFCSAYFRAHTVSRLFGPLIEALAEHDFEIELFALAEPSEEWSQRLQRIGRLHAGTREAPQWRELIVERELDVLIYPELGMHPMTQGLAALRLAPVQATLWGHPVTSGLPSIDVTLSPDAMEPADGQTFYSERLVRLAGLGHGLCAEHNPTPEATPPWTPVDGQIDLLCAQTVYKLLPEHDALFGRILARVPHGHLHLLVDDRVHIREGLRQRMLPTLRAAGADPERQLSIHGFVSLPVFLGLAQVCRLNLDSVGWSGGMSGLDMLSHGLPTVTLEGHSMRTRQTAALLRHVNLDELIATNADDYVERAVALATDAPRCAALRQTLLDRRDRLFADPATAQSLAHFLANVQPTGIG